MDARKRTIYGSVSLLPQGNYLIGYEHKAAHAQAGGRLKIAIKNGLLWNRPDILNSHAWLKRSAHIIL